MKYDWKFKLKCVEDYMAGKPYPKEYTRNLRNKIVDWVRLYGIYGMDGLKHKAQNREWTPEERYELVAKVLAGYPNKSVAVEAGINDGQLHQWVRKYKAFGMDGLQLRKGRRPEVPNMSKRKVEELDVSEREELIRLREEVEYLQTENAYLKKLRALIARKNSESSVKARRQRPLENSESKDTD